ncbi:WYL domain-containing protein, partial [Rivularia sp. UHCC 0363]|uniref:WYL domain-containing protein n=1 Tax=Rivularia sp. UHCC 0363 TaxID=3110244 RepID=UPI002B21EBB5
VEPQVKLLEWAIQSSQKVQFSYETRNGEKSDKPSAWLRDRTLTPISFKTVGQTLCLQGYCYLRSAKRNFAIIRMRDIKIISANQANYQKVISDEVITPPDVQVIVSPASQIPLPELTQKKKYEQVTSKELTTPPDVQIEASPISQSPLPEVTKTKNTETQVKQRPYLKYRTNELETIAASKWDNTEVLNKIHYELEFRSRTKALGLRQRITTRLTEIFESL